MRYPLVVLALCGMLVGCGTTKTTDTRRSATEQLLISDAMDRAVSQLDFRALAGKTAFIDDAPMKSITDADYLTSCMRQHMLTSGCILKTSKTEADYIVEVRAGAVGTDHHDLLYGVPAVNIPSLIPVAGFGIPSQVPEMPFVKRTDQRAVVKIALFAYNAKTGRPVWQSGSIPVESDAKAIWVFGAGPFQRGSIYGGTTFAGDQLKIPLIDLQKEESILSVADEAYFVEPEEALAREAEEAAAELAAAKSRGETDQKPLESKVIQTVHTAPAENPGTSQPKPPTPQPPESTATGSTPGGKSAANSATGTSPQPQAEEPPTTTAKGAGKPPTADLSGPAPKDEPLPASPSEIKPPAESRQSTPGAAESS